MSGATEAVRIEADVAKREALTEREHVAALMITNQGEYSAAVTTLQQLSAKRKEIDDKRKSATRPLDEAKRIVMEWWRPAMDNMDGAIQALRKAIGAYDAEREKHERDAAAKIVTAIASGEAVSLDTIAEVMSAPEVSYREQWEWELVDADAIPREYMSINEQKIGAVVRAMKADTKIPGVRPVARKVLVNR